MCAQDINNYTFIQTFRNFILTIFPIKTLSHTSISGLCRTFITFGGTIQTHFSMAIRLESTV